MKKGFTLLEILLVIAAIGILAAIVIVAINPNRQLAQVRDAKRRSELRAVYQAVQQYAIENSELPPAIQSISDNTNEELCAQNATDCTDLIDLRSDLVPKYLAEIPSDPLYFTPDETGYLIGYHNGSLYVVQETREDEDSEYIAVGGLPENFEATRGRFTWTPADITTALWLDAADESTITESGGAVSQWDDKSGNGRHASQSTPASRPTYTTAGQNGQNVLTFDGSDDGLTLAANLSLGTQHSIFVAAKNSATITASSSTQILLAGDAYTYPSTTTSEFLFGVGSLTGNLANERIYSVVLADPLRVYGYGKTDSDIAGGFIASSSFISTENVFSGRLNGATDFTTTSSAGGYSTTNTRFPTNLRSIGYRYFGNVNFWSGQIWEVIVAPSYLPIETVNKIEGYLAHKWGLTANLPVGHPYKNKAP